MLQDIPQSIIDAINAKVNTSGEYAPEVPANLVGAGLIQKPTTLTGKGYDECQALGAYPKRPLSYSSLKCFIEHPLFYLDYFQKEKTTTDAMILGSVFEWLLLNENLDNHIEFVLENKPDKEGTYATKANKAYRDAIQKQNKKIVTQDIYDKALAMKKVVSEHCTLIQDIQKNKTDWAYQEKRTATACLLDLVAISDFYSAETKTVIDIKTIADLEKVDRQFVDFYYWVQAAIISYTHDTDEVLFLFVETTTPYRFQTYSIHGETLEYYKSLVARFLKKFRKCLQEGFCKYDNEVYELEPSSWFRKRYK